MALKPGKTAKELEDMICSKINQHGVKVTVRSSNAMGWVALVLGVPASVDRFAMQARVDHEADELRNLYDSVRHPDHRFSLCAEGRAE